MLLMNFIADVMNLLLCRWWSFSQSHSFFIFLWKKDRDGRLNRPFPETQEAQFTSGGTGLQAAKRVFFPKHVSRLAAPKATAVFFTLLFQIGIIFLTVLRMISGGTSICTWLYIYFVHLVVHLFCTSGCTSILITYASSLEVVSILSYWKITYWYLLDSPWALFLPRGYLFGRGISTRLFWQDYVDI